MIRFITIKLLRFLFLMLSILYAGAGYAQVDTVLINNLLEEATSLYKKGQFEEAILANQQASELAKNGPFLLYNLAQLQKAHCYKKLKRLPEGDQVVNETLDHLSDQEPSDALWVDLYSKIAKYYALTNRPNEQLIWLNKELKTLKTFHEGNSLKLADCLKRLGYAVMDAGDIPNALPYFTRSFEIYKTELGQNHEKVALAYGRLGWYFGVTGNQTERLKYVVQYARTMQRVCDSSDIKLAATFHDLSAIYRDMGNYRKALLYSYRAIEICELNDMENEMVQRKMSFSLIDIASCHVNLGNFNEGITYYKRAVIAMKKGYRNNMHSSLSFLYSYLSLSYAKSNIPDSAFAYSKRAINVIKYNGLENSHRIAATYSLLAEAHNYLNDTIGSYSYAKRAISLSAGVYPPNNQRRINPQLIFASAKLKAGKLNDALRSYLSILNILEESSSSPLKLSRCFKEIGNCYLSMHKPDSALLYFQKGLNSACLNFVDDSIDSNPFPSQHGANIIVVYHILGKATAFESKYEQSTKTKYLVSALNAYQFAIEWTNHFRAQFNTNQSKTELLETLPSFYNNAIRLALQLFSQTGEKNYLETAHIFSEQSKSFVLRETITGVLANEQFRIPDSLVQLEYDLKADIAYYDGQIFEGNNNENTYKKLTNANKQFEELKVLMQNTFPDYYVDKYNFEALSALNTQRSLLESNDILISYSLSDTTLFVFSITKNTIKVESVPVDTLFFNILKAYRNSLSDYSKIVSFPDKAFRSYTRLARQLYLILFPTNCQALMKGKKRIILIPDGPLHHISFDALLTHSADQKSRDYRGLPYLGSSYAIHYAPSATLLDKMKRIKSNGKGYLGFAPSYEISELKASPKMRSFRGFVENAQALEGALDEVQQINELLGGDIKTGTEATESAFKQIYSQYMVLHLAMHALTDDKNPLQSQLIFSQQNDTLEDNFLNIYEIYSLKLNAKMAVLSACNTGYGNLIKGEGPMSLAQAFSYAGCPSVVMSQWRADDASTSDIMIRFFKHLNDGASKSEALQRAKLEYIEQADPAGLHPYFWANFSVIGSDEPVQVNSVSSCWLLLLIPILIPVGWYARKRIMAA